MRKGIEKHRAPKQYIQSEKEKQFWGNNPNAIVVNAEGKKIIEEGIMAAIMRKTEADKKKSGPGES